MNNFFSQGWYTFQFPKLVHFYIPIDKGAWYSVPYTLIGRQVEVCLTSTTVEIFHEGKRVASHVRSHKRNVFMTVDAHRPPEHKKHLEWTPERMKRWGQSIGPKTGDMIEAVIRSVDHPDHAFRKCLGLLRLAKSFSPERLEQACDRALRLQVIGYRSVKNILNAGLEQAEIPFDAGEEKPPTNHDNVRGSSYYAGGAS